MADQSDRDWADAHLVNVMIDIYRASDRTYGVPRMTWELAERGTEANHKRLMRANGLVDVHKRHRVRTTIPAEDNPPIPDLVGRRFNPGAPDVAWASDITYIRTGEGWLFLACVLDLGSRRLLGYSMADNMRTQLCSDALDMAVAVCGGNVDGIIVHVDRGSQCMSYDYRCKITYLGMLQSVGRTWICWDNAVAEASWASVKRELVDRDQFSTRAHARRAIFAWINYYNRTRMHSSLNYQAPQTWEKRYRKRSQQSGLQAA